MGTWRQHYKRAVYIDSVIGDGNAVEKQAQEQATQRGWLYERMAGDLVLIRRLFAGDWDQDFLVLSAGQEAVMTYDDDVIGCRLLERQAAE